MKSEDTTGWCSWCFSKANHAIQRQPALRRNIYQCETCQNETVQCRFCQNLARAGKWKHWTCAEHDGTVPSFEGLATRIDALDEYMDFQRNTLQQSGHRNWARIGRISAISLGAATIIAPAALLAAPAVGGAVGATFLKLSGAAATKGGLALMGGGALAKGGFGMAGGSAVVAAVGGSLGGAGGAIVGRAYLKDVEGFEILCIKDGIGPSVVVANGFLSQGSDDLELWRRQLGKLYPRNPWYLVRWESKRLAGLSANIGVGGGVEAARRMAARTAIRATKTGAKKIAPVFWALDALNLAKNPWHVAMVKAEQTGAILADAIARLRRRRCILIGHSLGARVMYKALWTLGWPRDKRPVRIVQAHLLGGAVGGKDEDDWQQAANATMQGVNVYYSNHDAILAYLYRTANIGLSDPIGLHGVHSRIPGIHNIDVSEIVAGHMRFKPEMHKYLRTDRSGLSQVGN